MEEKPIRPAAFAGSFYPDEPRELTAMVNRLMEAGDQGGAAVALDGRLFGLVVPHAGYMYSGAVAGAAYRLLRGMSFDVVVLLGPSHRLHFRGASIGNYGAYQTPLGQVPVETGVVRQLIEERECARFHPQAHEQEHCLEVQLPFLQVTLEETPIVPILIGDCAFQTCGRLIASLHELLSESKVLYIGSTDLSHYHTYEEAVRRDRHCLEIVQSGDAQRFHEKAEVGECELCGASAVSALLLLAGIQKASPPRLLSHANSGDVTGDRSRVVGYASLALTA